MSRNDTQEQTTDRISWRSRIESQQTEMRADIKGLVRTFDQFVNASDKRHAQHESEIDAVRKVQNESGKFSWSAVATLATIAALMMGGVGTLAVLYIAPVKTAQEAADQRAAADRTAVATQIAQIQSAFNANLLRLEDDRRRDQDHLDTSLQREANLLNTNTQSKLDATKEMVIGRLQIDEKRLDDVTNRVDRMVEDDRRELHGLIDFLLMKDIKKP